MSKITSSTQFAAIAALIAGTSSVSAFANTAPELTLYYPQHESHFDSGDRIDFKALATDEEDGNLASRVNWTSDIDGHLKEGPKFKTRLSDGIHNITISVTDRDNATSTQQILLAVGVEYVPNTPPELQVLSPTSGSEYESTNQIFFSAVSTDEQDGDLSDSIYWYSDLQGEIGAGSSFNSSLTVGLHNITVTARDSEGLETTSELQLSVVQPRENQAPDLVISSPMPNSTFDEGMSINFTATALDDADGDISDKIQWSSNQDGWMGNGASIMSSLSVGNHSIRARVVDSESKASVIDFKVSVTEGETENTAPVVTITSPANGSQYEAGQTVLLTANAQDQEDGNLNSEIEWRSDKDGILGHGANINSQLSDGTHLVTASVLDSQSATAQDTVSVNINALPVAGEVTIFWTAPTENTDNSPLTDLAGFKVYYGENAQNLNQVVEINDPNATSVIVEELAAGTTYYFQLTAVNASGVESSLSNQRSKTVN